MLKCTTCKQPTSRNGVIALKKIHYGWVICLSGTLASFCTLGLTLNFSVYLPHVIASGAVAEGVASSALITIRYISSFLTLAVIEPYLRRMGLRAGITTAVAGLTAGYLIFSMANSFPLYCVGSAISGVCYVLGGVVPISLMINRWFRSHTGLALGLCMAGSGIASMVAPPVITLLIQRFTLRGAFRIEAVFFLAAAAVMFTLVRNDPKDMGLTALDTGSSASEREKNSVPQLSQGQTDGRVRLYACAAAFLMGVCGDVGLSHLTVLYSGAGYESMQVATALSKVGLALTAAKCLYGVIVDRVGTRKTDALFYAILIAGLGMSCGAAMTVSPLMVTTAAMIYGFSLPLASVGMTMLARDTSTSETYAKQLKNIQLSTTVGMLAFSMGPGLVKQLTGTYLPAYFIITAMAVLSFVLVRAAFVRMKKLNMKGSNSND